jgi:hypothetical protein
VVVPWRVVDVVAKAAAHAAAAGADPAPVAAIYRALVDISIGEEAKTWDACAPPARPQTRVPRRSVRRAVGSLADPTGTP